MRRGPDAQSFHHVKAAGLPFGRGIPDGEDKARGDPLAMRHAVSGPSVQLSGFEWFDAPRVLETRKALCQVGHPLASVLVGHKHPCVRKTAPKSYVPKGMPVFQPLCKSKPAPSATLR